MHLHLDPMGGIAGDMFVAALLDARPSLTRALADALETAGISGLVSFEVSEQRDDTFAGTRVRVSARNGAAAEAAHSHRTHGDIQDFLRAADLPAGVRERALDVFRLLAEAEGRVHGKPVADVAFHEVGAWDSIADIVAAAWLIERFGVEACSCAPLPLGSGRVDSAHGPLPVPAPATALLLEGFPCLNDGVSGERVTPTGGAILRHLSPSFETGGAKGKLVASGVGFGARSLEGVSNVLRVLLLDPAESCTEHDRVSVLEFEVDDQSPEDLALALERLRQVDGVRDVVQSVLTGKKGRVALGVRALVEPRALRRAAEVCLEETTTLGVRWHEAERMILARASSLVETDEGSLRVKRALRPGGEASVKVEADDLAGVEGVAARTARRRAAGPKDG